MTRILALKTAEPVGVLVIPAKLITILAEHTKWLKSSGKEGKRANLRGAFLYLANLRCADLSGADMQDADLRSADMRGVDLRGADLQGANLSDANLERADLMGANLRETNLYGANLMHANLYDADLIGADLRDAEMTRADLRYTLGVINAGTPNGWPAWGWRHEDRLYVRVGCRQFVLEEGYAYWSDKQDRREIIAALDYIKSVAKVRGWIHD